MLKLQHLSLKKTLILSAAVVSLALGSFLLSSSPLLAQEESPNELTLIAIPPRVGEDRSLVLKPGDVTQQVIRLRNVSNQPITISSTPADFIIEDGTTPTKVKDTAELNRWSLANWMVITPSTQTVQPNQTVGISVLIQVPSDALPGGHYAMVTHKPVSSGEELDAQSAAAIAQEVGTLFYVVVDGPINEEAFIRDFTFPKLTEYGPVPFSFKVDNVSDVHITPQINVEITNMFGKKINTIKLDPKNVFPFTDREFVGEWDAIWGTGFYTAKLTMAYGSNLQLAMAKTSFWLLPIKLIIVIALLLLIGLIVILSIKSHLRHKAAVHAPEKIAELEKELKALKKNTDNNDTA